jgi:hypothetical protein
VGISREEVPTLLRRALPWVIGIVTVMFIAKHPTNAAGVVHNTLGTLGEIAAGFGEFIAHVTA